MIANPYQAPQLDLTINDPIAQKQITPTWRFLAFFMCMGLSTLILGGAIAGSISTYGEISSRHPDFIEQILQQDMKALAPFIAGFFCILFFGIGFLVLGIGVLRRRTMTRRIGMSLVLLPFVIGAVYELFTTL